MHDDGLVTSAPRNHGRLWDEWSSRNVDKVVLRFLDRALRKYRAAGLRLTLPSGEVATIGGIGSASSADLAINSYRAFWKLARGGALGFTESYMDGSIDTDDLKSALDYYVDNERALTAAMPSIDNTRGRDRAMHHKRSNTRTGSRRNIAAHYDLGNDFYRLWLDDSMQYSSGIYTSGSDSLEAAQAQKLARILAALELRPGHRVLEIGCGWGGLAEQIARAGAEVDAITISQQQLEATRLRMIAAGVADRVGVRFEDYRDTVGAHDRLVSIEMIEAVGEENWPVYFSTIADRLQPGGVAVIQAITIRPESYERYQQNPDFIQRYIFPGGMLPTVQLMRSRATEAGLAFEVVEQFASSYARTLVDWRKRFDAGWPRIHALGFDERFRRMWLYYLTYCQVGFERGLIDVGLYRLRKPDQVSATARQGLHPGANP